jgi:hypothetical protein|tara:strand:+ start:438 stop:695 length:258 start_codon:yes stop_codon:yes gene_type:complete
MNDNNNKQQRDCGIWNCITKSICNIYSYIKHLCGIEDDKTDPVSDQPVVSINEVIDKEATIKAQTKGVAASKKISSKRTKKPNKK